MPPYICPPAEIGQITSAMVEVARVVGKSSQQILN
jgi:adenosylmethionine-8-amino-7-oxononanoate aminotransferase